jgi:hypothetical protein
MASPPDPLSPSPAGSGQALRERGNGVEVRKRGAVAWLAAAPCSTYQKQVPRFARDDMPCALFAKRGREGRSSLTRVADVLLDHVGPGEDQRHEHDAHEARDEGFLCVRGELMGDHERQSE